ncbi:MAG: Veg family protein [Clostridiales bacterium]|jgi:uncharacterized protein Veg|nr:Veg family protein [Clostridiales bacterium]
MRKAIFEIDGVRQKIAALKGRNVRMLINRGRKRIIKLNGVLEDIYPSVFTIRVATDRTTSLVTYSYSDVLCNDVKITDAGR